MLITFLLAAVLELIQWFLDRRGDKKNIERVKRLCIIIPTDSISSRQGRRQDGLGSISQTACLGLHRMKYRSRLGQNQPGVLHLQFERLRRRGVSLVGEAKFLKC